MASPHPAGSSPTRWTWTGTGQVGSTLTVPDSHPGIPRLAAVLQRPVGQKGQRHHRAGSWDPRVQISDPPAPGAAQMLRKTVCAGLEKLGQGTSQRGGGPGEGEGPLGQRGEMRTGHFRAPITLVVGQSLRHGPQHPPAAPRPPPTPTRQMGEGAGGFGLSLWGHQAAGPQLCPGLQPLTPL